MCGATKPQEARYISQNAYAPVIVNPHIPRVGNGWGFVAICQHILSPGLGHLSNNFYCFWNPYTKCRGFAT